MTNPLPKKNSLIPPFLIASATVFTASTIGQETMEAGRDIDREMYEVLRILDEAHQMQRTILDQLPTDAGAPITPAP